MKRTAPFTALTALTPALLAACHTLAQPGSQSMPEVRKEPPVLLTHRTEADAGPVHEARLEDAGPPVDATPRWAKLPESSGELFSVLDGSCRGLSVHVLADATLVTYAEHGHASVVQLTAEGVVKLPTTAGNAWVDHVTGVVGRYPDALWLSYDDGGRCIFRNDALRLSGSTWKPAFDLTADDTIEDVQPYADGALGLHKCADRCGGETTKCVPDTLWSDAMKRTPPLTTGGFAMEAFTTLPSGEVFAVGTPCGHDAPSCTRSQLRAWSPGGKVRSFDFPRTDGQLAHVLARSPTQVVVSQGTGVYLFDGAKVARIATPGAGVLDLVDRGDEGFWARGLDKLLAFQLDGKFTDITPPQVGRSGMLRVAAKGSAAWVSRGDGLFRREAGAWKRVELPRPPFSSTSAYLSPEDIQIRAPDDVWVTASYHEQQPGWSEVETRNVILSTRKPKETLRCRLTPTGYDSSIGGIVSFPPPAGDACATPFVVLAPVSPSSPKDQDYPKTRALLKPLVASIADASIVELRGDDMVWIGVRATTRDGARKIAETYGKAYGTVHPEVVCANPQATRTIAIVPGAPKASKDAGL
jgi:hypothetical protein